MKSHITRIEIHDDLNTFAAIVETQDASAALITLRQGVHNSASWRVLSDEIAAAIAKMELDGDVRPNPPTK